MYDTTKCRELNDALRRSLQGGRVVATQGVMALPNFAELMRMIQTYDGFDQDNDPYGEHDFASMDCGGQKVFFKIDYYDLALCEGSPDPADVSVTTRVLTIMLAQEY